MELARKRIEADDPIKDRDWYVMIHLDEDGSIRITQGPADVIALSARQVQEMLTFLLKEIGHGCDDQ